MTSARSGSPPRPRLASNDGVGRPSRERLVELVRQARDRYSTSQDVALNVLREAILEGILSPGTRLRQEVLAALMETSRIPIREALRGLEYEGLVTSEPRRGFTVTALDADEIEETYELRAVLESHAVQLAIPLLTAEDLADLTRLHEEMERASDDDERLASREKFYLRLYSVTARPRLVGLITRLRQEVARLLRRNLVQHSPEQHRKFFEAVRHGDVEQAVAELQSHYLKVVALHRRFLREAKQGAMESHLAGGTNGRADVS